LGKDHTPFIVNCPSNIENVAGPTRNKIVIGSITDHRIGLGYLQSTVNGEQFPWLVDTGSSLSLVKGSSLDRVYGNEFKPKVVGCEHNVYSAGEAEMHILGKTSLSVSIGSERLVVDVVVCDKLIADGILGMDFLTAGATKLNLREGKIGIMGIEHKLSRGPCGMEAEVKAMEAECVSLIKIGPRENQLIKCKIKDGMDGETSVIEPMSASLVRPSSDKLEGSESNVVELDSIAGETSVIEPRITSLVIPGLSKPKVSECNVVELDIIVGKTLFSEPESPVVPRSSKLEGEKGGKVQKDGINVWETLVIPSLSRLEGRSCVDVHGTACVNIGPREDQLIKCKLK
jgi:hypothetical protein